jgi:hypothetical protein
MRLAHALLIASLGFGLSACSLRKPPSAKAATPPPAPAPAPTPAPPPEPLSIPQTNVHLPPPQPLSPEAIATTQLPGEPPPPAAPVKSTTTKTSTPRPGPRNTEPAVPAVAPPATPPAETEVRAPFTEVLSPAEKKRLQDEAEARAQEARHLIEQLSTRRRNQQKDSVDRAEAFLKQAQDAERRGDVRQASELAGRALVLARELRP